MNKCTCESDAKDQFLCDLCVDKILMESKMKRNTTVVKSTNGLDVIQCEMCEKYVKTEMQGSNYPFADGGSQIEIYGGYGEFYDSFGDNQNITVTLCHDCTRELFLSIPKLKKYRGGHSVSVYSKNYPLCCEYSWTIDKETGEVVYGTEENFSPQETFEIG